MNDRKASAKLYKQSGYANNPPCNPKHNTNSMNQRIDTIVIHQVHN